MSTPQLFEPLSGYFEVVAFYGPAGTGKSMRAQAVAIQRDVDLIIDDGLVICRGRIVAGKSAKAEENMVRAIRRAMFQFPEHRQEVRELLLKHSPCKIMVLATSQKMASDICAALGLPQPASFVSIEDVASGEEIQKALYERKQNKRHVIPASQAQIRRNFTGRLVGHLRNLFSGRDEDEKTIVRPPFSYYGTLRIDPLVIRQIAEHAASTEIQVTETNDLKVKEGHKGLLISMNLSVKPGNRNMLNLTRDVSLRVRVAVEQLTGMEVERVEADITGVRFDD